jgi:hypothetical protein
VLVPVLSLLLQAVTCLRAEAGVYMEAAMHASEADIYMEAAIHASEAELTITRSDMFRC